MENEVQSKLEKAMMYAAAIMWLMEHPEAVHDEMIKGFIELIKDRIKAKQAEEDAAKVLA